MSREALSLDISRVVSRVVKGEPIDTAENGAALAAKYPDLGMSATLIGQAIERAAGMVGMIRNAPEPVKPIRVAAAATVIAPSIPPKEIVQPIDRNPPLGHEPVNGNHTVNGKAHRQVVDSTPIVLPVAAQSIDDDLAAAIDAEIGSLVSGQTIRSEAASTAEGEPHPAVLSAVSEVPVAPSMSTVAAEPADCPASPQEMTADATAAEGPFEAAAIHEQNHASLFASLRRALFRA